MLESGAMSRELLLVLEAAFGGIGIFLLGMRFLSDGLQAIAGARLNRWIGSVADNRFLALLVGVGVTCVIQSSTATTVMVVGFVNSGVMTLVQGVAVVFGANVGTTLAAIAADQRRLAPPAPAEPDYCI